MGILDLIFPKKCFGCAQEGFYICLTCSQKLKNPRPICPVCLRPSGAGLTHPGCQSPQNLDGLTSLWRYEGAARGALLALKYKFASEIALELGQRASERLKKKNIYIPKNPILVPLPLHFLRGNWRGFNQAEEIGKILIKSFGWKFVPDLLLKKVATLPQTELKKEARLKNIKGAFVLNPKYKVLNSKQPILLFDDVWTTGSTLKEAAKALKKEGVREVWGLTLTRGY